MTEHEHDDDDASKIVEQFGSEIRAAIQAVADETPSVAKKAAASVVKEEARKSSIRWYLITILVAWVGAGLVAWLVNPPGRSPSEWTIHHANGFVETCMIKLDPATDAVRFECRFPIVVKDPGK